MAEFKFSSTNLEDINRSLFPLVILIISSIGIFWLSGKFVGAGTFYWGLFSMGIAFLVLSLFWTKSADKGLKFPIGTSLYQSVFFYYVGFFIPLLILFFLGYVTSQVIVPLTFGVDLASQQTFAAVEASTSYFWQFFVIVWTAGSLEPWTTGFGALLIGKLIGLFLRQITGLQLSKREASWFDFFVALGFSTILFVTLHLFNNSYASAPNAGQLFLIAGIFKLIESSGMALFNLFISFAFGLHQGNNLVSLATRADFGWAGIGKALITFPGGILISLFWVLTIFYVVANYKKIPDAIRSVRFGI